MPIPVVTALHAGAHETSYTHKGDVSISIAESVVATEPKFWSEESAAAQPNTYSFSHHEDLTTETTYIPSATNRPAQVTTFKAITLAGSATNGPILQWEWSLVPTSATNAGGLPEASNLLITTSGDFVNGIAAVQNPSVELDAVGGYNFSLRARNATGWSDPSAYRDGTGAQAIVFILTERGMKMPPANMYRYEDSFLQTIESMREGLPIWYPAPVVDNISSYTFDIHPSPANNDSIIRLIMNDGNTYTREGPISIDVSTSGPGGLEYSASLPPTVSGTGDDLEAPAGNSQTINDAAGDFTPAMVGHYMRISGCTNFVNNGLKLVTSYVGATEIVVENPNGVLETSGFTWNFDVGFLYVYAVKCGSPGRFDIIVTERDPNLGPEDHVTYKYICPMLYYGTTAKLIDMQQDGPDFWFKTRREPCDSSVLNDGIAAPYLHTTQLDRKLHDCVPVSAGKAYVDHAINRGNQAGWELYQYIYVEGETAHISQLEVGQTAFLADIKSCIVPITSNCLLGYKTARNGGTVEAAVQKFFVLGFTDKFLKANAI